jgi:hypothetical protein
MSHRFEKLFAVETVMRMSSALNQFSFLTFTFFADNSDRQPTLSKLQIRCKQKPESGNFRLPLSEHSPVQFSLAAKSGTIKNPETAR